MAKNLKWINKYSSESGYVKTISKAKGYFVSTDSKEEARKFRSDKEVETAVATLVELGEAENNNFEAEEA